MKQIKLTTKGKIYDLTPYVTLPINYNDDISAERDTAIIVLPIAPASIDSIDTLSTLDLSKVINPGSFIEYIDEEVTKTYIVREDNSETIYLTPLRYSHELSCVEVTKLLEGNPLASMTVTQPKSNISYAWSILETTNTLLPANTETTLTLQLSTPSTNLPILEGNIMKQAGRVYNIFVFFDLIINVPSEAQTITYKITAGSETLVETRDYRVSVDKSDQFKYSMSLSHTTLAANETVSVSITTEDWTVSIRTVDVTINSALETGESPLIYVDDVIDKMLIMQKIYDMNDTTHVQEYNLSDEIRTLLSTLVSPEYTWVNNTLSDNLDEIGQIKAIQGIPRIKDANKNITYDLVNEINDVEYTNPFEIKEVKQINLQSYSNAIEINAENVIESSANQNVIVEPYENGWMTLRSATEGPNQLTDTTVGLKTRFKGYRTKQVLTKGFTVVYDDASSSPASTVWDITDYVVEEDEWKSLLNDAFETSRATVKKGKGNTLYRDSQGRYVNFGYRAPKATSISANKAQAIYQIIFAVAEQVTGKIVSTVNGSVNAQSFDDLLDTQYRIYHLNNTTLRTRLYKHNARDFEHDITLYYNERARLNDSEKLGQQGQSIVNRNGNVLKRVSGIALTKEEVPLVGNRVGNQVFTNVSVLDEGTCYTWEGWLYENYSEISKFVGIDSAYRIYEIPNTDIVERKVNYIEPITVARTLGTPTHSILNGLGFAEITYPFANVTPSKLTYHEFGVRFDAKVPTDPDWNTFDVVGEGPIDVKGIGNSTVITMINKDNYSMDDNIEQFESDLAVPKRFQNAYSYVDSRGRFDSARYSLYTDGFVNNSVQDGELYPERGQFTTANKLMEIDIKVLKDTRETINTTITFPFFDKEGDGIRVYAGMGKYNGLAYQDSNADIVPVIFKGALPPREDITIKSNTYYEASSYTVNALQGTGYVKLEYTVNVDIGKSDTFDGWGLINKNNREMIFMTEKSITTLPDLTTIIFDDVYWYSDKTKGE